MTNWLGDIVEKHLEYTDTVLDLGCGIMQATDDMKCYVIVGVDIWDRYLDYTKTVWPTVKLDMSETDRFMDESYDVVICLDVVEHLDKELALKVIDECKRICRKKAIIYTPDKFFDNHQKEEGAWGMGGNPLQNHKCLILKQELEQRGYIVTNPIAEGWLGVYTR